MAKRELFPALRRALRPPETKGLPERVRASSSAHLVPGVPYRTGWDGKRAVAEGYEANVTVFRCIEVICDNAADQPIVLFQGGTEITGKKIDDPSRDPTGLLRLLNRRANPWETGRIFRHRLLAQYLLMKKGVFVEVIRTRSGRTGMLNLVDPDLVSPIPSGTDPMAGFEIQTPSASVDAVNYLPRFDPNANADTQPAAILWLRSPHPLVAWQGMSPIGPAGLDIDLERYARLYNRRFLANDGRPGGLLSVKGHVSPEALEMIQAQFTGGPESAGRTTVISADAVSYADTSGSPRDLMWGELSQASKSDICTAFGVPPSVIGGASGETFDNADADFYSFWEHRLRPLLGKLDDQLDVLTGGDDDDLLLRHDLSGVWVLGRHQRELEDRAAADLDRGAITYNEYREITGREPVEAPAADVLWVTASGKMAVAKDEQVGRDAVATPMASATAAPPDSFDAFQLPPAGKPPQLGPGQGDGARSQGQPPTRDGEAENMERADLLRGDHTGLEGKQRRPRTRGSATGARWH